MVRRSPPFLKRRPFPGGRRTHKDTEGRNRCRERLIHDEHSYERSSPCVSAFSRICSVLPGLFQVPSSFTVQALKCILRNVRYDTGSSVSFGTLSYSGFLHRGKVDCFSDSNSWVNSDPENMFSTFRKYPGKKVGRVTVGEAEYSNFFERRFHQQKKCVIITCHLGEH